MMPGPLQLLLILAVVLLLFGGRGKISSIMGDFGKGLKSFKKGMKDEGTEEANGDDAKVLSSEETETMDANAKAKDKTTDA